MCQYSENRKFTDKETERNGGVRFKGKNRVFSVSKFKLLESIEIGFHPVGVVHCSA